MTVGWAHNEVGFEDVDAYAVPCTPEIILRLILISITLS